MKRTGICTLLLIGGLGTLSADGIDSTVPFYYTVNGVINAVSSFIAKRITKG